VPERPEQRFFSSFSRFGHLPCELNDNGQLRGLEQYIAREFVSKTRCVRPGLAKIRLLLTSYHTDLSIISLRDARRAAYESTIGSFPAILIVMKALHQTKTTAMID
jgi:hypothetical protein